MLLMVNQQNIYQFAFATSEWNEVIVDGHGMIENVAGNQNQHTLSSQIQPFYKYHNAAICNYLLYPTNDPQYANDTNDWQIAPPTVYSSNHVEIFSTFDWFHAMTPNHVTAQSVVKLFICSQKKNCESYRCVAHKCVRCALTLRCYMQPFILFVQFSFYLAGTWRYEMRPHAATAQKIRYFYTINLCHLFGIVFGWQPNVVWRCTARECVICRWRW